MMFIMRHIEVVREKPEHVRKQIAFTIAIGLTAAIALLWLGASLAGGVFAIQTNSFDHVAVEEPVETGGGGIFGVAAALFGGSSGEPAHVEVVESAGAAPKVTPAPEPTIIPF